MEQPILTNKDQFPTEEVIYAYIGKSKALWQSVFEHIHTEYPELREQWKYYNDGKSWLLKVVKKPKTIFWLSVIQDSFRMTFYFTDKAEETIINSPISEELKEQFMNGKRFNKIRGLTITFKSKRDVEYAKALLAIKLSIR